MVRRTRAGNRSSQTANGARTSFGHDPAGRLLSTQTEGRSTSYTYDGLDRRASVTDATAFGSDTTSTTWDGLDPVATDSAQHGVTDLLRDPTGEVVFQVGGYDDAWVLGDARNVRATADAGGRITDLVDYTDFGAAGFESTGWASLVGNDGQPGDATLGLDHYYARDYDTTTGSWVQPDGWRGLLVRPQSLNRFAYVENSPVGFSDYLGFLPIGGGLKGGVAKAYAKHAVKKGGIAAAISKENGPKLPRHSMGTSGRGRPATLSRGGGSPSSGVIMPASRTAAFTTIRHASADEGDDGEWVESESKIASALGVKIKAIKDAMHAVKGGTGNMYGGARGNNEVEVNLDNGDVRVGGPNGDVIGNIYDTKPMGGNGNWRNISNPPQAPRIDWGPTIITVIGAILIIVAAPITAATG